MSANEVETKEKQKLPEIKNKLQHIHQMQNVEQQKKHESISVIFCIILA